MINDYDPELGTPDAHVMYLCYYMINVAMLHVFLEFGLGSGRAHTYFTRTKGFFTYAGQGPPFSAVSAIPHILSITAQNRTI